MCSSDLHTRHRLKDWRTRQSQYSGRAAINSLWIRVTQPKGLSALAYNPYAISPSADACTVWRFSRTRTIRQSFPVYADLVALDVDPIINFATVGIKAARPPGLVPRGLVRVLNLISSHVCSPLRKMTSISACVTHPKP